MHREDQTVCWEQQRWTPVPIRLGWKTLHTKNNKLRSSEVEPSQEQQCLTFVKSDSIYEKWHPVKLILLGKDTLQLHKEICRITFFLLISHRKQAMVLLLWAVPLNSHMHKPKEQRPGPRQDTPLCCYSAPQKYVSATAAPGCAGDTAWASSPIPAPAEASFRYKRNSPQSPARCQASINMQRARGTQAGTQHTQCPTPYPQQHKQHKAWRLRFLLEHIQLQEQIVVSHCSVE